MYPAFFLPQNGACAVPQKKKKNMGYVDASGKLSNITIQQAIPAPLS